MRTSDSTRRRRRLWRFAGAEFDEASWTLRVGGETVSLEAKPLEVLHELLLRAGEVITKDELLDAVWPGVAVVEGSLPTAISKLRKALGSRREEIIETAPRIGYRLACPVEVESIDTPLKPRFNFSPGDSAPARTQWQLEQVLGDSGAADVWLARHIKTAETRVFKFADTPDRLRGLKREASLSRLVFTGLGKAAPLPALLEWNFESSPYFLEYAYGGHDLIGWAEQAGGLATVHLEQRLDVAALICRAVAALHGVGVLHKDLKPANILVEEAGNGPLVRLADLGSGGVLDEGLLDRFHITRPDAVHDGDPARSGTLAYRAPELTGAALPTVRSDIYALGLILYQLAVGDFSKTLAPGWESHVKDPLLRDDIRRAAEGDPAQRLASAEDLAERLERRAERHEAAAVEAERAVYVADQKRLAERRTTRRPWVRAAAASLVLGLIATSSLAAYAWVQRDRAVSSQRLAETAYGFIAEDVLASPDPANSSADETVIAAIKRASMAIDERFSHAPAIAARLHLAVARAFYQRSDLDTARAEFIRADELFGQAGEADNDDAVLGRLNRIHMDSISGQPGRLEEAGRLLETERNRLGARGKSGEVGFALAMAEANYGFATDLELAEAALRRAVVIAEDAKSPIEPRQTLKARSMLVLTLLRQGQAQDAEPLARALIRDSETVRGPQHPDTLLTRQHWLLSLGMLGRHEDVLNQSPPLLAVLQQRLGADHRLTLALHSTRYESFAGLGRYEEAAREAERVWRGASASAGPRAHQALVGQIDYAAVLCRTPQKQRALPVALNAASQVEAAFGRDYPLTHVINFYAGECLLVNDQPAEAAARLRGIDRQKVGQLIGVADWGAQLDLALAESALRQGDKAGARPLFVQASTSFADTADADVRRRLSVLSQALGG